MLASLQEYIQYWTYVCVVLANLHQDSPLILRHGFWPQNCVNVQALETSLLGNEEVHKEFDIDDHYVGLASNRPPPFLRMAMDYHEGYMLILHPRDETYAKPVWMAKTLSKPNFATSNPHFDRSKWSTIDQQHGMKM